MRLSFCLTQKMQLFMANKIVPMFHQKPGVFSPNRVGDNA